MMRSLLHRLRREDGIALPTVMGALVVTATLATTTFAVSIDSQQTSAADRDGKRAAAAAQAALDLGFLRLTAAQPAAAQCVTDVATAPESTGECPVWTEPANSPSALGNGATMKYVVSTEGASGCRTLPNTIDNRTPAEKAKDRCVTATGTVNGVTRRLQTRIVYVAALRPWSSVGILGKDKVEFGNNKLINSPVGSNGQVVAGNNTSILDKIFLPVGPPAATYSGPTHGGGYTYPQQPFQFPDLDFSVPRAARINQSGPNYATWYANVTAQGAVYDNTNRVLRLDTTGEVLELPGGTYSFCKIEMAQNTIIRPKPNTGVLQIWIDSPRGDSSVCPGAIPNVGQVIMNNGAGMNVPAVGAPDPTLLELYVKGTQANGEALDVDFKNSNQFHGTIWAPFSTIDVKNNQAISGGFTGDKVYMKNNGGFSYPDSIRNKVIPGTGAVRREGWYECSSKPTVAADNESGCT
jgi:Tfp pilus assembly protein PilX